MDARRASALGGVQRTVTPASTRRSRPRAELKAVRRQHRRTHSFTDDKFSASERRYWHRVGE